MISSETHFPTASYSMHTDIQRKTGMPGALLLPFPIIGKQQIHHSSVTLNSVCLMIRL